MASPSIELQNVGMSFDDHQLIDGITLAVDKGESLVLIGPSGEGKSVLLKIMAGLLPPTKGKVFIEGKDLYAISESDRQKIMLKMGMLFQKNALFDSLTCAENISFPLKEVAHLEDAEIKRRIEFFLEEVAILHARDLYPDEISGGMQKRLGIARALSLDPEIIFYDDPTAGLDPITSRLIVDLICSLQKEKGSTLVSITNDMNRAYQMSNRIAMVVDGELIITGDEAHTKSHADRRVQQFISGSLEGPLTEVQ